MTFLQPDNVNQTKLSFVAVELDGLKCDGNISDIQWNAIVKKQSTDCQQLLTAFPLNEQLKKHFFELLT